MEALSNAHVLRSKKELHHAGFASGFLLKMRDIQKGVSSNCVQLERHYWFVFRVTYNRIDKAYHAFADNRINTYFPIHYTLKTVDGKKKRFLEPLLPNFIFAYTTREKADSIIKRPAETSAYIKYYLDKTKEKESNGFHPPLTIDFADMINFIRVTDIEDEHIMTIERDKCNFKNGDMVKVIEGKFKDTIGRVARVAGQQRIVIELENLCMVATAYVPSSFIEKLR